MYTINSGYAPANFFSSSNMSDGSVIGRLKAFGGLTFYKDYATSQTTGNADSSVGSGTVTVTAARSASAPGTYFNSTGGILSLTTANVPRWTQGYYDATGFHSRPGIMVESGGSATLGRNVIVKSDVFADVAWTNSNITVNDAENDGVLSATVSSLTASAGNATLTQTFVLTSSKYTSSIFIKRKTGTGTISLRANTADSYTDITANVGSSWTRVSAVSSTAANPTFDIKITTSGDAIYVKGAQLENYPFMTSYIPTDTAARTRATELIVYDTSGNRTATAETSFVKFTPLGGNFANDSFQRTVMASSTKNRQISKSNTSSLVRLFPNLTDNSGVTAIATTALVAGTSYVVAGGCTHSTPLPYARFSVSGTSEGEYTAGDWTDVTWGTTWSLGATSSAASQLNGIIEAIAIYSGFKDVPDTNHITNILDSSVTYRNYLFTPTDASATNVVSGGATGTVLSQSSYEINGRLVRTDSDTVVKFDGIGSDVDFNAGNRTILTARPYTISTNTWGTEVTSYDITSTGYVIGSRFYRVVGSSLWMYLVKYTYPLDNTGVLVLVKCIDLNGTSWGAESTITTFPTSVGQSVQYLETSNPNLSYLLISRNAAPRKVALMQSTDGGTTFIDGPVVYASGAHNLGEGCAQTLSDGVRIIAIFRDDTSDYLQMFKSSDAGNTWSGPETIALGAAGDLKPCPRLIKSAGYPTRLTLFFYDRGDGRLRISSQNLEDDAFNNTWRPIYALGTASNGQGDIAVMDETNLKYLAYTSKDTASVTDTLWWRWKDIYSWVAQ